MLRMIAMRIIICFMLLSLLSGCGGGSDNSATSPDVPADTTIDPDEIEPSEIETFNDNSGDICMEDGKPVIRMFSTTWCPHCQWAADAFDEVAQMYVDDGLIVAHHWELDTGDDTLTAQVEESVPESEEAVYNMFNPDYKIPTFVFGCRYYRIGTGHELEDDLEAEAAEFMAVIEELIDE